MGKKGAIDLSLYMLITHNLGLQGMIIHLQGINHTMQILHAQLRISFFCSFMQTGTQFTWKTPFSFVDVKIDGVDFGPPCLSIVNTQFCSDDEPVIHDGQWGPTHGYSIQIASVLLRLRFVSIVPPRACLPLDAAQAQIYSVDKATFPIYLPACPHISFSIWLAPFHILNSFVLDLIIWNPVCQLHRTWPQPILQEALLYTNTKF